VSRYRECSGPVMDRTCGALECPGGTEPDWDRHADWDDACRVCREGYDAAVDRAVDAGNEP